jgi:nucleoside-diphosphate-sugar epimerase
MKIHLVTGSTGFVGRYLVQDLLKNGEVVWVVIRPLHNMTAAQRALATFPEILTQWPDSFKVIEGDIMSKDLGLSNADSEALSQHEVILWHLAANLSFSAQDRSDALQTNIRGTRNVVDFANKTAARYMHMSTAYVCGDSKVFKETDLDVNQTFRNHYEQSKFAGEKYVRGHCTVPYIVFRPSIIIGDAYRGKAEGCTFGYYRYMFMFHFFKQQVLKALNADNFIIKKIGTRHNKHEDTVQMPWLIIPYPEHGRVNMVTVDFVVDSMIRLYEKNVSGITVHLTHHNPPTFRFILQNVLHDLGYRDMKLIAAPSWVFRFVVYTFYVFGFSIRKYVRSVIWYIPYVTEPCVFDRTNAEKYLENPPEISRDVASRINTYAKEHILDHITI